ncbi:hypothetical protein CC86DRAFT_370903 [Ophiobolus disseminans]|uniref:Uncharacterized protein n=1 Tax=Ophiobolus disseminans TaxID=1469910 RepID=A0A6A6ZXS1_9PLEO|nr:hypothetical protein CC86DRAFT_370903 [Ophiobolus disseminans]
MQYLAKDVIERYVTDKLKLLAGASEIAPLVEQVVLRSDGVFLWVALVVRVLRERAANSESIASLEAELAVVPDKLQEHFDYLLESLSPSQRRKACFVLWMMQAFSSCGEKLPLPFCAYLDQCNNYSETALRSEKRSASINGMVINDMLGERAASVLEDHILGCCKGLVGVVILKEMPHKSRLHPYHASTHADRRVVFVHRSIAEYIVSAKRRNTPRSFNSRTTVNACSQLVIMTLGRRNVVFFQLSHGRHSFELC